VDKLTCGNVADFAPTYEDARPALYHESEAELRRLPKEPILPPFWLRRSRPLVALSRANINDMVWLSEKEPVNTLPGVKRPFDAANT
jgi:hypothetical protein